MHIPVLLKEVVSGLNLQKGNKVIDCTFGDGGHTREILKAVGEGGRVLAIDTDAANIKKGQKEFVNSKNLVLVNDNFVHLKEIVADNDFLKVQGILLDLGWSSTQFAESGRGFSFLKDEPLDMRLGGGNLTAAEIVNTWPEKEIGQILRELGEEQDWKQIAKAIVAYRNRTEIKTTEDLVLIIKNLKLRIKNFKTNPATQVFQALRIAVNDELSVLKQTLPQALEILNPGGRLAVISFHSLEDRIVKRFFQHQADKNLKIINKKPSVAGPAELKDNPRSRSAKLRIAEKI